MVLVALVEIVAGSALRLNKYGALFALILMSISINAVLFHAVLDSALVTPAGGLLVLNSDVFIGYKDHYNAFLS